MKETKPCVRFSNVGPKTYGVVIVTAADLTFNQGVRVRLPPTLLDLSVDWKNSNSGQMPDWKRGRSVEPSASACVGSIPTLTIFPGWRNGNAPGFDPGDAGSIPAPGVWRNAWIRQQAERLGLNPSVCGFESHSRYQRSEVRSQRSEVSGRWVFLTSEFRPLTSV